MFSLNILVKTCITGKPESFSNKDTIPICTHTYMVQFELKTGKKILFYRQQIETELLS